MHVSIPLKVTSLVLILLANPKYEAKLLDDLRVFKQENKEVENLLPRSHRIPNVFAGFNFENKPIENRLAITSADKEEVVD